MLLSALNIPCSGVDDVVSSNFHAELHNESCTISHERELQYYLIITEDW